LGTYPKASAENGLSLGLGSIGPLGRSYFWDMRMRKVLAAAVAIAVAALLVAIIWPARPGRCPLVLEVASIEPAGIFDDAGAEMWMASLSISNSDTRPRSPENGLYVRDSSRAIEAKVANRWIEEEGGMACRLDPHDKCTRVFLLPADTESCRVRLKYAATSISLKWRLSGPIERLARIGHLRLPANYWTWMYRVPFRPSSNWKEMTVELPMPPTLARR
jgi:hypothetical protein